MPKRPTEGEFGAALRAIEHPPAWAYKPPDDARNWKPCDFMVWWGGPGYLPDMANAVWFEVKDTARVATFPLADLRPSQRQGIAIANDLGIPYWLAIYWRGSRTWTISDAIRVVAWFDSAPELEPKVTSIPRDLLQTRFGVACDPRALTSTLKSVLLGEVG